MDSAQMLSQLSNLVKWDKSDFTEEIFKSIEHLPESVLKPIYDSKVGEIRVWEQTAKLEEERKEVFNDFMEEYPPISDEDVALLCDGDELTSLGAKPIAKNQDGKRVVLNLQINRRLAGFLVAKLKEEKAKQEQKFDDDHKPKPVKKTGGKRSTFEGTTEVLNTPETPDDAGQSHKYYFKGDEKAVWKKTTSVSNGVKREKWKAVRSARYLGGADSDNDDGKCCGVCVWDKASGSEAIKKTGLSPSQFRVRCDESAVGDSGYCNKCAKKPIDFFEGTYEISRGSGKKFSGKTYKQFICEELEYVDEWERF